MTVQLDPEQVEINLLKDYMAAWWISESWKLAAEMVG